MSYILEALKKADADRERERSAVPSLHAHTDALGFERERRAGAALGIKLATGAALLLAGGGALWWWLASPSASDERVSATAGVAPAVAPAPAPAPAAAPPPPLPSPAPQALQVPAPQPVAVAPAAPAPAAVPSRTAPATATAPAPAAPGPVAPKPRPAAAAAAARPVAEAALPTRNQLPAELRAALPPLNVSGAVYAPAPSARLLFVNGLVLREGDAVSDGLNVERIGRTSSVLVFRGQRFELKH